MAKERSQHGFLAMKTPIASISAFVDRDVLKRKALIRLEAEASQTELSEFLLNVLNINPPEDFIPHIGDSVFGTMMIFRALVESEIPDSEKEGWTNYYEEWKSLSQWAKTLRGDLQDGCGFEIPATVSDREAIKIYTNYLSSGGK
jgi:hypothetical protein